MNSAIGYAQTSDSQAVGKRVLEVPTHLEAIERHLKGCHQGIDYLENRLAESVLRNGVPAQGHDKLSGPTAAANSPMGSRLQENATALELLNDRIQGLIGRLEA